MIKDLKSGHDCKPMCKLMRDKYFLKKYKQADNNSNINVTSMITE